MKKFLTLIVAAMATMTMSAQTAGFKTFKLEGALAKQSTEIAKKTVNKAPRKALAENQQYMGAYTTDEYSESGLGLTGYPGTYQMFAEIPTSLLSAYDGGQVKGMRFAVADACNTSTCYIYNYTESGMTLLAQGEVTSSEAGWNTVMFDTPFTLDLSTIGEIMMGYDYEQTSSNYPISVSTAGVICPTYLYGDLGQGKGYYDIGLSSYGNLCVQAIVEKEFDVNSVEVFSCTGGYVQKNEAGNISLTLHNIGSAGVQNISYTITCDGVESAEQTITVKPAITAFGDFFTVNIPVDAQAEATTKTYTVKVTKVNGEANTSANCTTDATVVTVKKLFTHRVAMEEFTGTGCGYCPRGWVAMNLLREKYGDDFVGIAIHQYNSSDPMYIASNKYASLSFSGAPSSMIERGEELDPYYGTNSSIMGIYDDFDAAKAEIAPVGVEVSGVWNEDKTQVSATASVESLTDNANYDIEYVLIADGLNTSSWAQSNYYYQYTAANADATGTPLADFCKGGTYGKSSVKGLTFNDVAIASSYVSGKNTAESLTIPTAYTPVESTCTMKMPTKSALVTAIKNADYDVWVAALIIDPTTGKIVNAVKAKVQEPTPEVAHTDLEFVDAEGNQIADGSTIVMDKAETNDWDETQVALTGVYVKNNTEDDIEGRLTATIDDFVGGSFQCCFGTSCRNLSKAGSLVIDGVTVGAGESVQVSNTEWVVGEEYGTLPVKFTLDASDGMDYTTMSTITVNFVYADPTGINEINANTNANANLYNLAGQRVNANAKGIVVKNGQKYIVK